MQKNIFNHNFDLENELRFLFPLPEFLKLLNLQANPLVPHPITVTDIYTITQSWFDLPPARLRIRKIEDILTHLPTSYTHTTKYPLSPTKQLEYESSISLSEYKILSFIYQNQPETKKTRYYFTTPENPTILFSADVYPDSKKVTIEIESSNPELVVIPKWLQDIGQKLQLSYIENV